MVWATSKHGIPIDQRSKEAEHLSMLRALVEAAEDIELGRTYVWDEFESRLARMRAKATRIASSVRIKPRSRARARRAPRRR